MNACGRKPYLKRKSRGGYVWTGPYRKWAREIQIVVLEKYLVLVCEMFFQNVTKLAMISFKDHGKSDY